jgi:hypothetical protein
MSSRQKSMADLAAEIQIAPLNMQGTSGHKPQEGAPEPEATAVQTASASDGNKATPEISVPSTADTPPKQAGAERPASSKRVPSPSPSPDTDAAPADSAKEAPAPRSRAPQRPRTSAAPASPAAPRRSPAAPVRRPSAVGPGHRTPKGMERKDVPFWIGDLDSVESLAKFLNRRRGPGIGERITYAMLVRVAVKGLLAYAPSLEGTTERELSESFLRSLGVDDTAAADLLYDLVEPEVLEDEDLADDVE